MPGADIEQRATGTLQIWMEPYTELRVPKVFNLRTDPFERADITSNTYYDWLLDHAWTLIPAQAFVATMLQTLVEFPPSQTPASFTINQVMEKLHSGVPSA
jgi:arylsulfatase